jgi:hypothetical protein
MINWLKHPEIRKLAVFLVLIVGLSFSIVYTDVRTYNVESAPGSGYNDSLSYLDMYFGKPGKDVGAYRPFIPWLARLIPDPPKWFFSPDQTVDRFTIAAMKFGIINFFFLIGACLALYFLQCRLKMGYFEALLGVILFLSSSTVVRSAGLPLTDTAFFFFFTLCTIAIQGNNLWLLLFAGTVGALAKELVVILTIPLILLSLYSWKHKLRMLLMIFPGIALYLLVRFTFASAFPDKVVSGQSLALFGEQLVALIKPRGLIQLFFSFGLVWIPAIYALASGKVPLLLKRWSWLILIVFLGVLLLEGNFDRTTFSAFVVIIPLASLGLSSWLDSASVSLREKRYV